MPTYDYKCECGYIKEFLHGMNDTTERLCPECDKVMKRQIGKGCGVHFKGTGFYKTDYPKEK